MKKDQKSVITDLVEKINDITPRLTAAYARCATLKDDIHKAVVRDGIPWDPNFSFEDNVRFHRREFRGHGEAQHLHGMLPKLEEEASQLQTKINGFVDALAKACAELNTGLQKKLKDALDSNLARITERILRTPPLCDEAEAKELATGFSCNVEIEEMQRWARENWFRRDHAVNSARALLREVERPVPVVGAEITV